MKHWIEIEDTENRLTSEEHTLIAEVVQALLQKEQFGYSCYVSVSVANEGEIRELNREHRGVDRATDVLSFPALTFDEAYRLAQEITVADTDPETGAVYLGDMVLCNEVLEQQAEEYGHSKKRELSYLVTHSMYHLLGYDHETEDMKREMRTKEEALLSELKISRETE